MKEPATTDPSSRKICRVLITDFHVTDTSNRPARYLDVGGLVRQAPDLQICCADTVETDEEVEQLLGRWMRSAASRALLGYGLGPWVVLRHLRTLRRADVIVCYAPHYFWLVVLLNRLWLLPRGKVRTVRGIFFRTTGFQRKCRLFLEAPAGFQAAFATRQQVDTLADEGVPAARLRYVPWRIDTGWFRPRPELPAAEVTEPPYVLCPGSARRDEALVNALVGRLGAGIKIVRMGRMSALESVYHAALQRPDSFELRVNSGHREYLRLLQGAALVILPIVPCDEPAGLTAALEALACEVPLLANESMGIGPLLRETGLGDTALLPDLDLATWEAAVRAALAARGDRTVREAVRQARAVVVASHAIRADDLEVGALLSPARVE